MNGGGLELALGNQAGDAVTLFGGMATVKADVATAQALKRAVAIDQAQFLWLDVLMASADSQATFVNQPVDAFATPQSGQVSIVAFIGLHRERSDIVITA